MMTDVMDAEDQNDLVDAAAAPYMNQEQRKALLDSLKDRTDRLQTFLGVKEMIEEMTRQQQEEQWARNRRALFERYGGAV